MKEIFRRSEHNPLITVTDLPYVANAVFNAGEDAYILATRMSYPGVILSTLQARGREAREYSGLARSSTRKCTPPGHSASRPTAYARC